MRILEVAEHAFVPTASAVLADWGAEVIKVEHAERGDAMRGLASSGVMPSMGAVHVLLEHSNRGKKSIGLDLTTDQGLDVLYRIAATCDVFLTNKLPAVRTKLRIEPDADRAHDPNIIYVAGTGAGAGPGQQRRLRLLDRTGAVRPVPWARPPPTSTAYGQPGPAYGDSLGGMTIAGGILGALFHRERTGEALDVDISLLAVGMWAMSSAIALSLALGFPWRPGPSGGGGAPGNPLVGTYRTADDRFIALSCLQGFHYWPGACRAVGRQDLIDDERFSSHEALTANAAEGAPDPPGGLPLRSPGRVEGTPRLLRRPVVGGPGHPRAARRPPGGGQRLPPGRDRRPRAPVPPGRRAGAVQRHPGRADVRGSSTSTATRSWPPSA